MARGLVLGGGGVAGIAWEIGLLTGLADGGVDVTGADRLVGTSAGSAVAAQVTSGAPLAELYERQVSGEAAKTEIPAQLDVEEMMREWGSALTGRRPGAAIAKALGGYAMRADTVDEPSRRAVIEARLPRHEWPDRDLRVVAVDARSGRTRVFTRAGSASLVDAVAASCAVPGTWPPVTIGRHRYIDGGTRSAWNVDLARGCDRVLVLAPMPELPFAAPDAKRGAQRLREASQVLTIAADEESAEIMGANPLDPAAAAPAASAGRAQAAAHVDEVKAVWGS